MSKEFCILLFDRQQHNLPVGARHSDSCCILGRKLVSANIQTHAAQQKQGDRNLYSYIYDIVIYAVGSDCEGGSREHWLVCLVVFLVTLLRCHSDIWNIKHYHLIFPLSNIHLTLKWCLLWPLTWGHSRHTTCVTVGHDPCCACRCKTTGGEQLYSVKCCTMLKCEPQQHLTDVVNDPPAAFKA